MEKPVTDKKRDLLTEDYKGTGAIISSLGYSVVESKIAMVPGAMLGGIASAFSPQIVESLDANIATIAKKAAMPDASFMRQAVSWPAILWRDLTTWAGNASIHVVDFFYRPFNNKVSILSKVPADKLKLYTKGIANGAGIGIVLATGLGVWHGVSSSNKGEKQFDHAKNEIKTLRNEKEALVAELDTTSKELAKTKAEAIKHTAMHDEMPGAVISHAEHAETVSHKPHHPHRHA